MLIFDIIFAICSIIQCFRQNFNLVKLSMAVKKLQQCQHHSVQFLKKHTEYAINLLIKMNLFILFRD